MEKAWELAAVSGETEIEVSAGNQGVAVKAKGGAADRLGHALADLVSPFSQLAGAFGDGVSALRIYQRSALESALSKAIMKMDSEGIEIRPVPTKFLIPWIEGASSEDVGSEESLTEMWANLLVNAASGELGNKLIYVDILKKITKNHVSFLKDLVAPNEYLLGNPRAYMDAPLTLGFSNFEKFISTGATPIHFDPVPISKDLNNNSKADLFADIACEYFYPPGMGLLSIDVDFDEDPPDHYSYSTFGDFDYKIISSLSGLNILVYRLFNTNKYLPGMSCTGEYICLTESGADFVSSCLDIPFKTK